MTNECPDIPDIKIRKHELARRCGYAPWEELPKDMQTEIAKLLPTEENADYWWKRNSDGELNAFNPHVIPYDLPNAFL